MSPRVYCCLLICLLCCCGTRTQPVPQSQRPGPSRVTAGKPRENGELSQRATRKVREIAELRGWDPSLDVTLETAGNSRLEAAILADEESQIDPAARQAEIELLVSFGFVPENFDFERDVTQRFSRDLQGLYSFTWRRILLAASRDYKTVESTLRHELVHAFQDKYYNVGAKVRWREDQGDRIAAIHSLAEGEAICVARQLEDPLHRGCLDTSSDDFEYRTLGEGLQSLPPAIRYALLCPYVDGTRSVQHLLRQGGWQAVDYAWRGNLNSTRELLHPGQSSLATMLAIEAPSTATALASCHLEYLDVLGEQGLSSMLFDHVDPGIATQLAASLISDRAGVWRCGGSYAVAWRMQLTLPKHASRVASVISASLTPPLSPLPKSPTCGQNRNGVTSLLVLGRDIAITSVHQCIGENSQNPTVSCEEAENWAKRLIGL